MSNPDNKNPRCAGALSPLPDSNRGPPPYHGATRREPRARAGYEDQREAAKRRNPPRKSDLFLTREPALMFPQCSLRKGRPAPERGGADGARRKDLAAERS